ncbi:MAG TPA: HEAT repeat domain-containing protein, partial [Candidatus Binataceae bacterium]|nr:HEAT repeat domain-containing protein [Candidatus Binataceae bacterium]
ALAVAHAKITAGAKSLRSSEPPKTQPLQARNFDNPAELKTLHDFSIVTLRHGLSERDPFEQLFAAGALGVNGDAIGPMLLEDAFYSPDPSLRMASVDGLADIGDAKAVAVLQRLFYESTDDARRRLAVGGLSQIKDCAVTDPLLEAAEGSDPEMRMEAAQALGNIGCKEVVKPLLALFSSERDPFTQTLIGHALLLLGDNSSVQQIETALEHNPQHDVQAMAALALGDARDIAMVKPLRRALTNSDIEVRMAAATALTHYSRRDGLQILRSAIVNRDYMVRHWLSDLLERLDFGVSRDLLTAALDSADPGLQLAATKAIGLRGGEHEVAALMRQFHRANDPIVRADVAWALGRIARPNCIQPLLNMIAEPDPAVRYTAADALARTTSRLLSGPAN